MPRAGLYVHIPFCEVKCGYCDFFVVAQSKPDIAGYVQAVCTEAELYAQDAEVQSLDFDTVYLGGGTPSLLSERDLSILMEQLHSVFPIDSQAEVTLETNPGTVDFGKLLAFKAAGINRLSLGIQSFRESELTFLDRTHSEQDARKTYEWARKAGYDNISFDLIFGLPEQTLLDWEHNLEYATTMQPEHISIYNHNYETGTPLTRSLKRGAITTCPEEIQRQMFLSTIDTLEAHGYRHYELSNYARPGKRSRHNSKYWNAAPYLGIGVSSHSYLNGKRFWNVRNLSQYCSEIRNGRRPVLTEEMLTPDQRMMEDVLLGLRQRSGLSLNRFQAQHGISIFEQYAATLAQFFVSDFSDEKFVAELTAGRRNLQSRLMVIEDGFLKLTRAGLVLYDSILDQFV